MGPSPSILASDMGADAAAVSLDSALTDLDPDLVICLGIAGSLNDDAMLGDVCLSSQIVDVLNNSKVVDQPIRRRKPTHQRPKNRSKVQTAIRTELSPRTYIVDEQLSAAPRFLRSQPLQASVLADLVKSLGERWSKFTDDEPKAAELVNAARTPEFHVGPIVCGPVTVSKGFKDRLRDHNRKILAVETESGTVFRVCEARRIPSVTIRGISDYADKNKTRLEQDLKDTLRRIAMANACDFFSAMLRNVMFLRAAVEHAQPGNAVTHMPVDDEELLFLNSRSAIQAHLERASAEYKNRPLDAPLPIPRVRRAAPGEDADEYHSSPRSVFEALNEDRRIFIKIPRSYPEANVAWYLGASLLQHGIDGKQIVPLVVDAQDIRPPAHTFVRELGVLATALERQNIQPVIIINEPEFDSDSRTKFLSDQIKSLGSVATIIVSKLEAPVETIDTFKVAGGFTDYLTASVPLAEIAGFLEKAFEMPPEEADVVATRLDDTFSKFRLHTHPAYFIGLQETAIEALIDANQRAELIQLAVDGILSFVVANDKSEFRVSRTTREEFLTELAVDLRIEKRAISKASFVARVEAFAEQKGARYRFY